MSEINSLLQENSICIIIDGFVSNGFINKSSSRLSLSNIKKINLFIGPNNCGKSRLLRHIFNNEIVGIEPDEENFHDFLKTIETNSKSISKDEINKINFNGIDSGNLSRLISNVNEDLSLLSSKPLNDVKDKAIRIINNRILNLFGRSNSSDVEKILSLYFKGTEKYFKSEYSSYNDNEFRKVYIPILRGLRPLTLESDSLSPTDKKYEKKPQSDLFLKRTVNDYNLKEHNHFKSESDKHDFKRYKVFTGHSLYHDLIDLLLGGHDKREKINQYESYLSKYFFNGKSVTLTPKNGHDVVNIKIGDSDERPIYELGDGLQTILVITFPIFTATNKTQFFIEEPETHLHPGLQRALLDAIATQKEHLFFITTHSNHLIDLSQENESISIQRVIQQAGDDGRISTFINSLTRDSEILDDLGVRASSVLLANCSIWIEGITDKLYLRSYLKKYIEELKETIPDEAEKLFRFKENLHFIFTEYQGSNITHWYFGEELEVENDATPAPKLCSRAYLIADGDIHGKGEREIKLKGDLGDRFELLEYKEIENYIPESILKKASLELWNSFNSKEQATFIESEIKQKDYGNKSGVGEYLETFVKDHPTKRRFFEDKSGTIKDKIKLCRIAVRLMDETDDWELTPELEGICKRIFEHIKRSNHA